MGSYSSCQKCSSLFYMLFFLIYVTNIYSKINKEKSNLFVDCGGANILNIKINLYMNQSSKLRKNPFHTPERPGRPDRSQNKRIQSTTPPTVEPGRKITFPDGGEVEFSVQHTVSRRRNTPYLNYTEVQLRDIVMEYEHRLRLLKEYLNNADAIERIKVAEIFGLGIGKSDRSEESLVLHELSTKVHDLLRENKELKSISKLDLDSNLEYLIKENKKLKMILEEYKSSENSTSDRLKSENYQLKVEIDRLRKQLSTKKTTVVYQTPPPPITISQPHPISVSKEHFRATEQNLGNLIHTSNQSLQAKYSQAFTIISRLENRLNVVEKQLAKYKQERQMKIDSTIRKSLEMSQAIKRPVGQIEEQPQIDDVMESKNVTFGGKKVGGSVIIYQSKGNSQELNKRLLQSEERSSMLQQKNRFLQSELIILKRALQQSEQKQAQKVESIIKLESQLRRTSGVHERRVSVQQVDFERQIKHIKQTLMHCNPSNFDIFFSQFQEIVRQRNELRVHLDDIKRLEQTKKKQSKQSQQILQHKVQTLTIENKTLLKRLHQLEQQIERTNTELITSQIDKLKSLTVGEVVPGGEKAIEWQKVVRNCIETSIEKLESLERKMVQKKKFIKVTQ